MPAVQSSIPKQQDFYLNKEVGGGEKEGHTVRKDFPQEGWVSAITLAGEFPHADLTRNDVRDFAEIIIGKNIEGEDMRMVGEDGVEYYDPSLAEMIRQYIIERYGEGLQRETEVELKTEKRKEPVEDTDYDKEWSDQMAKMK